MKNKNYKKIAVAISGGVDSAVACFLLKQQGYNVTGIFMTNWETNCHKNNNDLNDAILIADTLSIPLLCINFSEEYKKKVFNNFIEDLKKGITPNPDMLCNRYIKFGILLEKISKMNFIYLATGHYARISIHDNKIQLLKAIDKNKDQSYFLSYVNISKFKNILFPLGNLKKEEVRKIAKENNLHVHGKKDSVGICFIGEKNFFQKFLTDFIKKEEGIIKDTNNNILGKHKGLFLYTIGQRKGLNLSNGPWYVVNKNLTTNELIISNIEDKKLYSNIIEINKLNILDNELYNNNNEAKAKFRYRQEDQDVFLKTKYNQSLILESKIPQKAITPGQFLVLYKEDICIASGIIEKSK